MNDQVYLPLSVSSDAAAPQGIICLRHAPREIICSFSVSCWRGSDDKHDLCSYYNMRAPVCTRACVSPGDGFLRTGQRGEATPRPLGGRDDRRRRGGHGRRSPENAQPYSALTRARSHDFVFVG